jgi:UrcA family protein
MLARPLAAVIALGLLAAPAAVSAARNGHDPVTVTVEVGDLDPANPSDRTRFQRRLESAARAACDTGLNERWARAEEDRCVEEIVSSSMGWGN